jgi:hypothetical protein
MIANQSATFHGSIHRIDVWPFAADSTTTTPVMAQRIAANITVATISLRLAANATTHPMSSDASQFAMRGG